MNDNRRRFLPINTKVLRESKLFVRNVTKITDHERKTKTAYEMKHHIKKLVMTSQTTKAAIQPSTLVLTTIDAAPVPLLVVALRTSESVVVVGISVVVVGTTLDVKLLKIVDAVENIAVVVIVIVVVGVVVGDSVVIIDVVPNVVVVASDGACGSSESMLLPSEGPIVAKTFV
jgi:hypothetical protein